MAISRVSQSTVKQGLDKSQTFTAGIPPILGKFYHMGTVEVGAGGASSIEFTGIPAIYKHLQVRGIWTASSASELQVAFNSDTTNTNYYRHQLYGTGSSAVAGANQLRTFASYSEVQANVFTAVILDVLNYTIVTKNKTSRNVWGQDKNGSGYVGLQSGLWLNTAAISSIVITPSAGTISQYSTLALYGVK